MPVGRLGVGQRLLEGGGVAEVARCALGRSPESRAISPSSKASASLVIACAGTMPKVAEAPERRPAASAASVLGPRAPLQVALVGVGEAAGERARRPVSSFRSGRRGLGQDLVPLAEPQKGGHRREDVELACGKLCQAFGVRPPSPTGAPRRSRPGSGPASPTTSTGSGCCGRNSRPDRSPAPCRRRCSPRPPCAASSLTFAASA